MQSENIPLKEKGEIAHRSGCQGLGGEMGSDNKLVQGFFWGDEYAQNETVVMLTQLCKYHKNHCMGYFKWVDFMLCKLDLNKAVLCFFLNATWEQMLNQEKSLVEGYSSTHI